MSTRRGTLLCLIVVACVLIPLIAHGQNQGGPPAATSARASAPVDLTGYWVALVTEEWRFRMITPPKGDYSRVPMTPEARKIAEAWNPAADEATGNQCKAYGAGAIMRVPTRLHITWAGDNTLKIDTDAGTQTRLFHFDASPAPAERTWQGHSRAQWERPAAMPAARPAAVTSDPKSLKAVTANLRSGYLRRNGVPYSDAAVVTEYFDVAALPGGGQVLLVTTRVDDPRYLQQPFIVSSQFKKESDGSKWDPTPCSVR
jgi:hypothetical protein